MFGNAIRNKILLESFIVEMKKNVNENYISNRSVSGNALCYNCFVNLGVTFEVCTLIH